MSIAGSLAILVPVLRRPQNVEPLLESIWTTTPEPYRVVFICDPDDHAERHAIHAAATPTVDSTLLDGNYAQKINAGVRGTSAELLFLGADDLNFHPGWLEAAKAKLTDGVGVVGTQDLCNRRVRRGEHSTHSLVTREYAKRGTIDEPVKLLHEGYEHEFVDDEFVETAKHRGAFAFARDSVVEHLHPDAGKAPMDDLYAAQGARMTRTRPYFETRRALWTRP